MSKDIKNNIIEIKKGEVSEIKLINTDKGIVSGLKLSKKPEKKLADINEDEFKALPLVDKLMINTYVYLQEVLKLNGMKKTCNGDCDKCEKEELKPEDYKCDGSC